MQITGSQNGGFPSPNGVGNLPADIASQLREQQEYHRRVLRSRALAFWWWRVLLIVLVCAIAVTEAGLIILLPTVPLSMNAIIGIIAAPLAIPICIVLVRYLEFSLLLFAVATTSLAPKIVTVKSADIYPSEVMMAVLFAALLVYAAFRVRKLSLPPLRAIWPQVGLLFLALVSDIMVQFTWTHGVPKKINANPIVYDEILGVLIFTFPLIVYTITTMIIASKESLMRTIPRAFMIVALFVCVVVFIEFRSVGASVYTFRYEDPHIFWMDLRAVAQIVALGSILAYARFLYATTWRQRFAYLTVALICLSALIISLQNSWWLEAFVGMAVMTVIFSWRIALLYIGVIIPLSPLLYAEYLKLTTVKTADFSRLTIWQDALRVWSKQRLLGVGPGNFWEYDQIFTNLPRALRDCNKTGLCVAHNGYLQILGEEGILGLLLFIAFPIVIIVLASLLYRRAYVPKKADRSTAFFSLLSILGFRLADVPPKRTSSGKSLPENTPPLLSRLFPRLWNGMALFSRLFQSTDPSDKAWTLKRLRRTRVFWVFLVLLFSGALYEAIALLSLPSILGYLSIGLSFLSALVLVTWLLVTLAMDRNDDAHSDRLADRRLALVAIGITSGSMLADFFAGGFFIPPRQISIFTEMPQVITSWIIWAFVMYRDQQWRTIVKKAKLAGEKPIAYADEPIQKKGLLGKA